MSNPIKPTLKTEFIPILFLVVAVIASFYFYNLFPDSVVTHWDAHGNPNGWSSKAFAAFFFPPFTLALYLLMLVIPYFDPKKSNYDKFTNIYHIIKGAMTVFLVLIYFVIGLNALGYKLPVDIIVPSGVGVLFIVIGAFMGNIKQNWFMGIRTPWTLSSEVVWKKTHKFGAKVFMIGGLLVILASFLPDYLGWFLGIFAAMILSLFIYSYLIYRDEK